MSFDYTIDPENTECESCGFEPVATRVFECNTTRGGGKYIPTRLCEVCASSPIGNAYNYPGQYPDVTVLQTIGFCTNLILKRLADQVSGGSD